MTTTRIKTRGGTVETCCHRVSYFYRLEDHEFSDAKFAEVLDDSEGVLEEAAEERAKAMIIEGCHCGELNCLFIFSDGTDAEIWGWWNIEND